MPFEPISPVGAFTAGPELPKPPEEEGDSMLATAGKIAAPVAVGAGLLFAPEITLPALAIGGGAALFSDREAAGAAFRQENTIGSLFASQAREFDGTPRDPNFDPWAEIADSPYEPYYEQFSHARNRPHFDAIKSDIDRENKDRDTLAKSGLTGMGATMAAGLLDWPTLLPGGAVLRTAKGEASVLRSAAITAGAGVAGAAASEGVLQSSQQLRTSTESAVNIGGAAILAGLLGAGAARSVSRAEMDGLAPRVSRDFEVPGAGHSDVFEPGGLRPRVEAVAGASPRAMEIADAIRQTAEEILPAQVRVQVVDSLGVPGGEGRFGVRGAQPTEQQRLLTTAAWQPTRQQFEQMLADDLPRGRTHFQGEALEVFDRMTDGMTATARAAADGDADAARRALAGALADAAELDRLAPGPRTNLYTQHVRSAGRAQGVAAGDPLYSIRAYHGTPHDFDRFDMSKIGTGEGAQVFGHGLYFAESEGVAKSYQLSVPEAHLRSDPVARRIRRVMDTARSDEQARERLRARGDDEAVARFDDVVKTMRGNLYEVDIDTKPEQLIELEKPISEQSAYVRERLKEAGIGSLQGLRLHGAAEKIARRLREAGIPGIRYLDQGSRNAAEGTRNIVIFDDSLVKITKKNGEPVTAAERKAAVDQLFSVRKGGDDGALTVEDFQAKVAADPSLAERIPYVKDGTDPGETYFTVERDGKIVGVTAIEQSPDEGVVWSKFTSVDPAYRKQGIAKELVAKKLAYVDAQGKVMKLSQYSEDGERYLSKLYKDVPFVFRDGDVDLDGKPFLRSGKLIGTTGDQAVDLELKSGKGDIDRAVTGRQRRAAQMAQFDRTDAGLRDVVAKLEALRGRITAPAGKARVGDRNAIRKTESGTIAEGRFDPETLLITIAADALDPAKTLRHESIHALKQMGLFTGKEWQTLEAAARKQGWVESNNVRALYEGVYKDRISDELLAEEAIAEQFSLWRQGAVQVKGVVAKLFERMQQFLERTGNALRGRGFQTADDVFAAVRGGDVASRAPGASPVAGTIPGAAGLGRATSVGASAVDRADDTLKSAFGMEKAMSFQDPMLRLQTSQSPVSRRLVQELAETPLTYEKNALGKETAPEGSQMGAPGAVETRIKFHHGPLAEAVQAVDNAFLMYRKGRAKRFPGEVPLLTMKDTIAGTDALTYRDFKGKISEALRRGDESDIPEVAGAARIIRQKVLDPLKDEAIEAKLLPEDVTPETAASYLNRVYNKDRIIAERDQVKTVISDWLTGQESINRGVRTRLAPMLERRQVLEARVAKYERQIESRKLSAAKVEARRQEASGLNRFAFQRAQKLSEPLDQTRAEIDAISAKIATEMERIDELTAAIRAEKANLPQLQSIERQSIKLAHGLAKVKRDASLIDVVEGAAEIEASMKDLTATFKGVQTFLRQEAQAMRAEDWAAPLVALEKQRAAISRKVAPFTKQLGALRKLQQKTERARLPGARGGAVFESKIRSRVNTLADQEAGRKAQIEALQSKLDRAQDELSAVRSDMEAQIEAYQGKSAGDAKGAIKSRAKTESLRTPEQRTKQPRLGSADKAVVVAARKIAAQLDKEPGEIADLADQIIDRIIGHPDGRLPYDAHLNRTQQGGVSMDVRGPLAARQFMIPDAAIEQWLENDIEMLLRAYVRTMAADVELTKRFGDTNLTVQMKELEEDYAKRSAQAKTPKERKRINDQLDADKRDLAAIRDRLRGTYRLPSDPNSLIVRTGRVISSLNYMRMLGGMTLSAIPDVGGVVFSHGLMRVFGDGLIPLLRNWRGARIAAHEVKMAGTALDMVLDSRAMQIADVMDDFGRHTKFERAVSSAARNFGVVSLMAPWNAAMKQFTGLVTMTRMLKTMERYAVGKANRKEIERLASAGISEANARKIAEQFAKHGTKDRGVWLANTAEWDAGSRAAVEAFRAALVRDVDRIIITPGQDRPLWMSSEIGRLVGQFKSFSIAAMQRIVIAGLQQRDGATLSGIIMMTALGGLASALKAKVAGQPMPGWDDPKKRAQLLVEAVDRSGLTGWLMEANSMTEKLTRGAVGLSAITGKPVSRYAQRNIASALLGPTAGTIQDFARVAGAAASGEWSQSDTRVTRRLIPYNNLFYARRLFDEAEAGVNAFLGVPMTAATKH
jgi:GNAT superfamily N-acetyltransferase